MPGVQIPLILNMSELCLYIRGAKITPFGSVIFTIPNEAKDKVRIIRCATQYEPYGGVMEGFISLFNCLVMCFFIY
jgi:hypothetical protein